MPVVRPAAPRDASYSRANTPGSSSSDPMTTSAAASSAAACVLVTPTVAGPRRAARLDPGRRVLDHERLRRVEAPSRRAAVRSPSGAGLPRSTSPATTITAGGSIPTAPEPRLRQWARRRGDHRRRGPPSAAASASAAPGIGRSPRTSSACRRSTSLRLSHGVERPAEAHRIDLDRRGLRASPTASSSSAMPFLAPGPSQHRARVASRDSTSTPSRSNRTARTRAHYSVDARASASSRTRSAIR